MLNTKKLDTKIINEFNAINRKLPGTATVKEGVTVFFLGKLRIVRIDQPSSWCATLYASDRPSQLVEYVGKIFNGSAYVDCLVKINTAGEVRITDMFGAIIPNAQYNYVRPRWLTYFVD